MAHATMAHRSMVTLSNLHQASVAAEPSKPITTRYLGHVTGYQPIREQYSLIR